MFFQVCNTAIYQFISDWIYSSLGEKFKKQRNLFNSMIFNHTNYFIMIIKTIKKLPPEQGGGKGGNQDY